MCKTAYPSTRTSSIQLSNTIPTSLALPSDKHNTNFTSGHNDHDHDVIGSPSSVSHIHDKHVMQIPDDEDEAFFLVSPQEIGIASIGNNGGGGRLLPKRIPLQPRPCSMFMEETQYHEPTHFDATMPSNTHHNPRLSVRRSSQRVSFDENDEVGYNSDTDMMGCYDSDESFSSSVLLTPPIRTRPLNLESSFLR